MNLIQKTTIDARGDVSARREEVLAQRECKRLWSHRRAAAQLLCHDEHSVLLAISSNTRCVAFSGVHRLEVAAELYRHVQVQHFMVISVARDAKDAVFSFTVPVLRQANTA